MDVSKLDICLVMGLYPKEKAHEIEEDSIYGIQNAANVELCPQKWTFGHTKTDTYRFKEQFHRFETVMPETRYVDDVSH